MIKLHTDRQRRMKCIQIQFKLGHATTKISNSFLQVVDNHKVKYPAQIYIFVSST